jgi:hypothetical protein
MLSIWESWQEKRPRGELPKIDELARIADLPLSDSEKIPISARQMDDLVSRGSYRVLDDFCTRSDVELLFRLGVSNILSDKIVVALVEGSPPMDGTENSFHSFWDRNLRDILEIILPRGRSIRNSHQNTETGVLRPDYAFLLKLLALFRGEEESPSSRNNPKKELSEKLLWAYRPAPYILGEC